jgi:hypothetical protein
MGIGPILCLEPQHHNNPLFPPVSVSFDRNVIRHSKPPRFCNGKGGRRPDCTAAVDSRFVSSFDVEHSRNTELGGMLPLYAARIEDLGLAR